MLFTHFITYLLGVFVVKTLYLQTKLQQVMELELYRTTLMLAGAVNILIAIALLHNNIYFRFYDVYHRARSLVALNYIIFGIGFLLHAHFGWRTTCPEAASTLTVTYFHSGGILFGWSHTSLMRPDYLKRSIIIRDLTIYAVGLVVYWTVMADWTFAIFFVHASYIIYIFYRNIFMALSLTSHY